MSARLFRRARIYTPLDPGRPAAGPGQDRLESWADGALLVRDGRIAAVGGEREVLAGLRARSPGGAARIERELDCEGRCLIPGFVDPHTHLCFTGRREAEFLLRLAGAEYLDILKAGGGILATVAAVRAAPEEELFAVTRERALAALRLGTTTVEIKSGYGLSTEAELKQLRVIGRVGRETPLTVVPTFMGAHAVPPEFQGSPEGYLQLLVNETIPAVARAGLARFCDVFCERGVFTAGQSRRILEAARAAGLGLKIHADEVHAAGGAALAAEMGAASAEHLRASSPQHLRAMAAAGVVGVLLPATSYSLRKAQAPARAMIELGLPVAIATDCNPGSSFTESMPFVFGLAVLLMGLTVGEALTAATLNAAYAVGLGDQAGSLSPGKAADFLLLDGETPGILAYHAGVSPVAAVFKGGEPVGEAAGGRDWERWKEGA